MSFSAYDAFNTAHNNMDRISMLMQRVPNVIKHALISLVHSSDEELKLLLPEDIKSIKGISSNAVEYANSTVVAFDEVKVILEEIIKAGTNKKRLSEDEIKEIEIEIEQQKKWEEHYKKEQEGLEKDRKELKKELDKAEHDYQKAMENLPTGWSTMGMNLMETVTKSFGSALGIAMETGVGLAAKFVMKKTGIKKGDTEKMADIFRTGRAVLGIGKDIGTTIVDSVQSPVSQAVEKITVPKCNKIGSTNGQSTTTMERNGAAEFLAALTDLIRTGGLMEQFTLNIFDETKANKKKLADNAEQQINFLKSLLEGQKQRLSSKQIAVSLSSDILLFYSNIIDLAGQMAANKSPESVKNYETKVQELLDTARCFTSWAQQILQLPPMEKANPFHQSGGNQKMDKSAAQIHAESAQMKVKTYQEQFDRAKDRYREQSEQILETNTKLTEAINKLIKFKAEEASLGEIMRILQDALAVLNKLSSSWLELLEFFQKIQSIIETTLSPAMDSFVINVGITLKGLKLSEQLKFRLYDSVQEARSIGHLIGQMSKVYVGISTEFLLPKVRNLGVMLSETNPGKINKIKMNILREAKAAQGKLKQNIEDEAKTFADAIESRMAEIENSFTSVFENIPKERRNEVKQLAETARAATPTQKVEVKVEASSYFID